jgi:hypothetical protein
VMWGLNVLGDIIVISALTVVGNHAPKLPFSYRALTKIKM